MNINLAELNYSVCYESKPLPPLDTDTAVNYPLHASLIQLLCGEGKKKVSLYRSRVQFNLFKPEYPHSLARGPFLA